MKPVTAKGAAAVTPVIVRAEVPPFDNVTACDGLVVFTSWFPKPNELGDTFKTVVCDTPVPESDTDPFPPKVSLEMVTDPE